MTERSIEEREVARDGTAWPSPEARTLLDSMSEYFVALDRRYYIVFANRAFAEHRRADPVGRSLWDLWPELRDSIAEEAYRQAFELGLPQRFDLHHEASSTWLSVSAFPYDDSLHVFFHDITSQKRAEAESEARNEFARSMLDSIPQIAWRAGIDQVPVQVNRRWQEYTGRADFSSDAIARTVHPDDLKTFQQWFDQGRERVEGYHGEARLRRHDGRYRWHFVRVEPCLAPDGDLAGWIGTSTDIHDLRAAEELLAAVTDAVPAFIAHIDRNLIYRFCNRRFQDQFGKEREEIVGHSVREVVGEAMFARLQPYLMRALAGERAGYAQWLTFPNGDVRFMRATYIPSRSADGRVDGIHAMIADETEARQTEEALRDRETLLRSVLETVVEGVVVLDLDGRVMFSNPTFDRLHATSTSAFRDLTSFGKYFQILGEDGVMVPESQWPAARGLRGETVVAWDLRVRRRDIPHGFWGSYSAAPVRDSQGKIVAAVVSVFDITERVQAEERARRLVESVPEIAWTARPDGSIDYFNERWYEFTGLRRDALDHERWREIYHPDELEPTRAAWNRSIETGEPYEVEMRLRHGASGEYRWFLARGRPLRDADGAIVRWFGVTSDIDELKRTQHALAVTNRLGATLGEDLDPDRIVQALTDASTEAVGAEFGSFFYAKPDEEERFGLFVLSGAPREAFASFPSVRSTGLLAPTFRGEGAVRTDDVSEDPRFSGMPKGHLPVRSYLAVTVRGRDGEVLGGLLFGHSEPARFSLEHQQLVETFATQASIAYENAILYARLREAKEDLERRVRERTSDLQDANEALQAFTYHVSHDLRAPLRSIVATSRIVQEDFGPDLPEEVNRLLARQSAAASKLGRLIDDLLRLSRLKRAEIQKRSLDLGEIAKEVASDALSSHPGSQVRIEVQEGLSAVADPSLIRLALGNLIENAVKYSPEGGTVTVGRRADGVYFVTDEGIGIDPEYFAKIFEPFQRLHRDEEFAGTGIGLSNVRQVVERHGGQVWAESIPGKGSTFLFTLG